MPVARLEGGVLLGGAGHQFAARFLLRAATNNESTLLAWPGMRVDLPLEQAPGGYKTFRAKAEGCVKVLLKP